MKQTIIRNQFCNLQLTEPNTSFGCFYSLKVFQDSFSVKPSKGETKISVSDPNRYFCSGPSTLDFKKEGADQDPDDLNDGEDAEADAEAEDAADVGDERDPGRPEAGLELKHGGLGEEDFDGGDVPLERVVADVQL